MRRYVAGIAGSPGLVDELVQDIWLRMLLGIGRLRDPSKFRAWIFGIAHRRLMDQLRERYASPVNVHASAEELAAEQPVQDREMVIRELEQGLGRLPAAERDVLSLFYLEELSQSEIATVLDVPVGTVKSRLFRARNLLRHQISGVSHE